MGISAGHEETHRESMVRFVPDIAHVIGYSPETRGVCVILLELNSLSVFMFNLCHDSVGVKGLGFLLHTVFWKQVCRCNFFFNIYSELQKMCF